MYRKGLYHYVCNSDHIFKYPWWLAGTNMPQLRWHYKWKIEVGLNHQTNHVSKISLEVFLITKKTKKKVRNPWKIYNCPMKINIGILKSTKKSFSRNTLLAGVNQTTAAFLSSILVLSDAFNKCRRSCFPQIYMLNIGLFLILHILAF